MVDRIIVAQDAGRPARATPRGRLCRKQRRIHELFDMKDRVDAESHLIASINPFFRKGTAMPRTAIDNTQHR
jgi:hypothetical protein